MRRDGTDPNSVQMSDVLCDFCTREWREDLALVEGHHGSCICGDCLAIAYRHVCGAGTGDAPPGYRCTMCLEERPDAAYRSPIRSAFICKRCATQAARVLDRDPDVEWNRPDLEQRP